jgi:prepilin-type N-terminal cleavage/methylation domain-containing protein
MAAPFRVSVSAFSRIGECRRGFTLLEMLVALALATLMIGAMLGLISESLRYKINLKDKAQIRPVLEAAAQILLADPVKAMQGSVHLEEFEGAPTVGVNLFPVQLGDSSLEEKSGGLYRVLLSYGSGKLEFSMIVPSERKEGGL